MPLTHEKRSVSSAITCQLSSVLPSLTRMISQAPPRVGSAFASSSTSAVSDRPAQYTGTTTEQLVMAIILPSASQADAVPRLEYRARPLHLVSRMFRGPAESRGSLRCNPGQDIG